MGLNDKSSKSVLVVDDNKFYLQIIEAELVKLEYEVFIARDGETALEMAKEKLPDLMLLDLILPKMDGFEVITELKKDTNLAKIKVVIFSQLSQKEDIEKVQGMGADAYMIKRDFSLKELVAKIDELTV